MNTRDDIKIITENFFLSSLLTNKINHIISKGRLNKINDSLLRAAIKNIGSMYQYFFKARDKNKSVDSKNSALSGKLYNRMTDAANPMPPTGILPGTVTQIIENWINDGLLEE